MNIRVSRDKEATAIIKANRAVAVAQLMRGVFDDWNDFIKLGADDLSNYPRRNIKAGYKDVKQRLSKEINSFCKKNFANMNESMLASIYDKITVPYGLEMPLVEFERMYSAIQPKALNDTPKHATVVLSLWGLQFEYPEDKLAKDVLEAYRLAKECEKNIDDYRNITQREARVFREEVAQPSRKRDYAVRTAIICCFNLIEAYMNGLAWEFVIEGNAINLSNNQRKIVEDAGNVSLKDKIIKYPEILTGSALWNESEALVQTFLKIIKPFRDSIVHPSPFAVPERFGGYDKLQKLYSVDIGIAREAVNCTVNIILKVNEHVSTKTTPPKWILNLITETAL